MQQEKTSELHVMYTTKKYLLPIHLNPTSTTTTRSDVIIVTTTTTTTTTITTITIITTATTTTTSTATTTVASTTTSHHHHHLHHPSPEDPDLRPLNGCHIKCPDHFIIIIMMIIIIIIIIIIIKIIKIIIALKGAIPDFLQSPHCATNRLQHVRSSDPGAIVCKSRATTRRTLITCNMSRATWYEGTAQLLSLTELKSHLFELYFTT